MLAPLSPKNKPDGWGGAPHQYPLGRHRTLRFNFRALRLTCIIRNDVEHRRTTKDDLAGKKDKLELLARMRAGEGVGGAESKVEIRDRMLEVVTEIAEKNRGKKVLIVSHGAVTAAFMREVMHLDPMFDPSPVVVNNTSLTTLQLSDQTDDNQGGAKTNAFWKVLCLGDTSHQDAWLAVQIEEAKAAASTQTLLLTAAIVTAAALIRASLSP